MFTDRFRRISFKDMKIKHKLMGVMMLLIIIFCIVVIACLQFIFHAYDEMLYGQSAQTINNSIGDIENEISNIEKLSLTIAADTRIQEQLSKVKEMTNEYDRALALTEFKNKIFVYMLTEKHISSIQFMNDSGYSLLVGQSAQMPDESKKEEVFIKARHAKGGNVWVEPDATHPYLLAAREIRSTGADLLEPLGTLLFQVNLDSVVQQHQTVTKESGLLYIWKDNQPIYTHDKGFEPPADIRETKQGFTIQKIDGMSSFIAYTTSRETGWTYYSVLSYNNIFKKKNDLRFALLVVVILLFITVIAISYRFARGITKPIELLTQQMRYAEKGDFGLIVTNSREFDRSDEVGYLQKRFFIMIQRIDALIEENYTRQLMLKDTEYRALQAQINPHFLYNTLTSINWMARVSGQAAISSMVEALSRLLRNAISNNVQDITIGEEMASNPFLAAPIKCKPCSFQLIRAAILSLDNFSSSTNKTLYN
ncbi:sensor histidine kinase [Paenibacillus sp. 2RAB27]|uniref:cache domain-containing sensor histidine kinase n=1 Tax=Paenibacillus sp. 2RAB27 TaxID=3232991 RepID=UPI003F979349